jgi:excisionase family DNA binding protein
VATAEVEVTNSTPSEDLPEYPSIKQTAAFLGMSYNWVRERVKDGTIPSSRFGTRVIRISKEDLIALLKKQVTA